MHPHPCLRNPGSTTENEKNKKSQARKPIHRGKNFPKGTVQIYVISVHQRCYGVRPIGGYTWYPREAFAITGPDGQLTVPDGLTVYFSCFGGLDLVGPTHSTCRDGAWTPILVDVNKNVNNIFTTHSNTLLLTIQSIFLC